MSKVYIKDKLMNKEEYLKTRKKIFQDIKNDRLDRKELNKFEKSKNLMSIDNIIAWEFTAIFEEYQEKLKEENERLNKNEDQKI